MIGFEIARLNLTDLLARLQELQEISVLPIDDDGTVVEDDPLAHDSAREMRLLLQRLLDLDLDAFLEEMRRLYFHLFAIDHDHYRDLLFQAAQKDPGAVRDFSMEFLTSEEILFFDDQYTLHDLIDVLELLGPSFLGDADRARLTTLFKKPLFRLPSVIARLVQWLAPTLTSSELSHVRRLFEMDWIPATELSWDFMRSALDVNGLPTAELDTPVISLKSFENSITIDDFESLRWMAGLEGSPVALRLRMLGSLVARGPEAADLFLSLSETQPETAFNRTNFETEGQRYFFMKSLDRVREEIVREAHHSGEWLMSSPMERAWPWSSVKIESPWSRILRELPMSWAEFADATDNTDFAFIAKNEIKTLDDIAEKIAMLISKHTLPSADHLAEGEALQRKFRFRWDQLLPLILPRLDVLP